jgi:hypothetical protein
MASQMKFFSPRAFGTPDATGGPTTGALLYHAHMTAHMITAAATYG